MLCTRTSTDKLHKNCTSASGRISVLSMVGGLIFSITRTVFVHSRRIFFPRSTNSVMSQDNLKVTDKKCRANFRLCNVAGCKTDLLEIRAQNPAFHVLFIPGNPGVVSFYTDFVEWLYELLGRSATVTVCNLQFAISRITDDDWFWFVWSLVGAQSAIAHVSHTEKNWEHGRLFSLQEQIDHKMSFMEQEFEDVDIPILLVGHSIGAYICVDMFKRSQEKVRYCVCLYPFLAVNTKSSMQSMIRKITASPLICTALSSIVAFFGMLPIWTSRFLVKSSLGKVWSSTAVDALCTQMLQYHSMRNVLFMAMTEFNELSETPDWDFLRVKKNQIAFLFGLDDHWGPLHLFEEISKQVPDAVLAVERQGHSHAFSCTKAGSLWVAQHVASLIQNHVKL